MALCADARRKRRHVDDRRRIAEGRRDDLGGLPRAHQRARQDHVERDVERDERLRFLAQLLHAFVRQRPLGVVRIILAALGGHTVADQVQLELVGPALLRARADGPTAALRPRRRAPDAGAASSARARLDGGRPSRPTRARRDARRSRRAAGGIRGRANRRTPSDRSLANRRRATLRFRARASAASADRAGGRAAPGGASAFGRAAPRRSRPRRARFPAHSAASWSRCARRGGARARRAVPPLRARSPSALRAAHQPRREHAAPLRLDSWPSALCPLPFFPSAPSSLFA